MNKKALIQASFSSTQTAHIIDMIKDEGLWDTAGGPKGEGGIFNTLTNPNFNSISPPVGIWTDIYNYIYSIIKDNPAVDDDTKMWFSAAGAINKDDTSVPATSFIRGATQYGLEFAHKVEGLTQDQINAAIQKTSNLIGQGVIGEILAAGGMPEFGALLTKDISAAIGNSQNLTQAAEMAAAGLIRQDIGGWGGSFYYWDQSINYGQKAPKISVGDAIVNGAPSLRINAPSYDEFISASASAAADATMTADKFVFVDPLRALKNTWDSIKAGTGAHAPIDVKAKIFFAANLILLGRSLTGNDRTGPHSPQDFSSQTLSVSGGMLKMSYSDGDNFSVNLGSASGAALTWSDWDGATGTVTANAGGSGGDGYTGKWTDLDGAGSQGQTTYNADGTSVSKITYASGSYATVLDDGWGNITTDCYTKNGNLIGDSWIYADGSSGSETSVSDGLTHTPGATNRFNTPVTAYKLTVDADGNHQISSVDANDANTSTQVDAQGLASAAVKTQGSGVNFSQSGNTRTTTSTSTGSVTRFYDGDVNLTHDTWTDTAQGTSGSDTYNASGLVTGKTLNADGSSDAFTLLGTPGGANAAFAASSQVTLRVPGPFDITHDHINADGTLASDTWTLSDGASGSGTFAGDGSGSETILHSDGTTSTLTVDAQGHITVDNLDNSGTLTSRDWWKTDGTHGITDYKWDGSQTDRYSYDARGNVVIDSYASDGSVANEQTKRAGAVLTPDGTSFGKIVSADGRYTVDFTDAYGDVSVLQYGAGGQLKGTSHSSDSRTAMSDYSSTAADGSTQTSPLNSASAVVTGLDGTQRTLYFDNAGRETGNDWIATDGSHGTDTYGIDGSSMGDSYKIDGTSYDYTDDGLGNVTNDFYDANDFETGDAWERADGSHGSHTYNADGSSSSQTVDADGFTHVSTDDGQGNSAWSNYNAAGVLLDSERKNPDGSYLGTTYNPDGSYTNFAGDGLGNSTQENYSSAKVLVSDSWTAANGNSGSGTFDASGTATGAQKNADGSSVIYTNDGKGNTRRSDISSAGLLLSDTWTEGNGTFGTTTYNPDGSVAGSTSSSGSITLGPQDSYAITTTDASDQTITRTYKASGVLARDEWSKSDGSRGNGSYKQDGTAVQVAVHTDGSLSVATLDGAGGVDTKTYSSSDTLTGDNWSDADGSHGSSTYSADGSTQVFTADGRGETTTTTLSAAGVVLSDSWSKADGSHGNDFYNADGSHIAKTTAANGDTTTKNYSSAGVELSNSWTQANGSAGSDTFSGSGAKLQTKANADNSHTSSYSDAYGNRSSSVFDSSGRLVSDTWAQADGTSGSDSYDASGNRAGITSNGHGKTLTANYNAAGMRLNDSWHQTDGTHGSDVFNADGSSTGTTVSPGGSQIQTSTDAAGNSLTNYYSASGILLLDRWLHADGSSGSDQLAVQKFNPANYQQDGVYSTSSVVNGRSTLTFYNANNQVIGSTSYDIPTQAVLANGLGGGYGGPLSAAYEITLTAQDGGESATARISLQSISDSPLTTFGVTETATQGSGVASWSIGGNNHGPGSTTASWQAYDKAVYDQSGSPVLSSNTRAGAPPTYSSDLVEMDYFTTDGVFLGSSSKKAGWTATASSNLSFTVTTQDLGPLQSSGGGVGIQTPAGGSVDLSVRKSPITGQSHLYATIFTPTTKSGAIGSLLFSDGQPYGIKTSPNYKTVATYENGVTATTIYQNYYRIYEAQSWSNGQYWEIQAHNHIGSIANLPGGITESNGNYYLNGKPLAASNGTSMTLDADNGLSIGITSTRPLFYPELNSDDYSDVVLYPDPTNNPSTYAFDLQSTNTEGVTTHYDYTYDKLKTQWTNPDGSVGTGVFDLRHNSGQQTVTYADGTWTTSTNDGQGNYAVQNYDSDGSLASDTWTKADGSHGSDTYGADSNGLPTQGRQFVHGDVVYATDASNGAGTSESFYNASEQKTAEAVFDASGNETKYKTYDSARQLTQDLQYSDGKVADAINYSNGVRTDIAYYDASGTETVDARFDAAGAQTDFELFGSDGEVVQDQQFVNGYVADAINFSKGVETDEAFYNASRQETAAATFDASGNETAYYKFDSAGQLIQAQQFSNGHVADVINLTDGAETEVAFYSDSGVQTIDVLFNTSGTPTDYVFFDADGRMTQDQQFADGYVRDAINYSNGVATDEAFYDAAGQETRDVVFGSSGATAPPAVQTSLNQLVSAMAAFAPPASAESNMALMNSQTLHAPLLAASH